MHRVAPLPRGQTAMLPHLEAGFVLAALGQEVATRRARERHTCQVVRHLGDCSPLLTDGYV